MATESIRNIFLSASIPLPSRDAKYIDTADIIAIRDAVIALATLVLPHHRIIWGGHPSITPLIYYVMQKMDMNIQEHVTIYQSKLFEKFFPKDNNRFNNIILTDIIDNDRDKSLLHMRNRMLGEFEFSAAVFIGGMDGIEIEYNMFKEFHPAAILLPIASTGAATKIVYDNLFPEDLKNLRFEKDYGYMSLFQKFLMDKI
ncbi:SLOG domain-containing protein [Joostella sp. CR20]|uniref:SLOG domain-containing protein n=1 Tax=Joostella sp. CR20 TaxID=2804312 RepID=UPI00313BD774